MGGHACDDHFHGEHSLKTFDGNPNISVAEDGRTATFINSWGSRHRHLLGAVIYEGGEHDIYIILETVPFLCSGWIGMATSPTTANHNRRVVIWSFTLTTHCNTDCSCDVDLGQPWHSGDKLHLHLDVDLRSVSIVHLRTNKRHTVGNLIGHQRLYISVQTDNEAIITVSKN